MRPDQTVLLTVKHGGDDILALGEATLIHWNVPEAAEATPGVLRLFFTDTLCAPAACCPIDAHETGNAPRDTPRERMP